MSSFIEKADYKTKIKTEDLEQILDDSTEEPEEILDDAESQAIQIVKDALVGNYDIDSIFSATGEDRKKQVLWWVSNLVIYFLYERIPDDFVTERVVKNYDDTMDLLDEIADSKRKLDLPVLQDPETGHIPTKFRYGSLPSRSH